MNHLNCLLFFIVFSLLAHMVWAKVHVRGYYKKNGTYVSPQYKKSPNNLNHATDVPGPYNNDNYVPKSNGGYMPINNDTYMPVNNGMIIYKWVDKKGVTHFSDIPLGRNR